MATAIEYKKMPDGTFEMWRQGGAKMTHDKLKAQKAQMVATVDAFTEIRHITKEGAQLVAQILQQKKDLVNLPDFTWQEIVDKFMEPYADHIAKIDSVLKENISK